MHPEIKAVKKLVSHAGHVEGHIHVDCDKSAGASRYSSCEDCNGFLDQVKLNIYELEQSAKAQGLCHVCGSDWCSGCSDE